MSATMEMLLSDIWNAKLSNEFVALTEPSLGTGKTNFQKLGQVTRWQINLLSFRYSDLRQAANSFEGT